MNYYTQLQNIIKECRTERHNGHIKQFEKVIWPILKERAKSGEMNAYFCGMNRTFVEAAHEAGLLEGFSVRKFGNDIAISWT